MRRLARLSLCWLACTLVVVAAAGPVRVEPVTAPHGMVVAGHPEAAQVGVDTLKAGGSAIDAAVAVSLALGRSEERRVGKECCG